MLNAKAPALTVILDSTDNDHLIPNPTQAAVKKIPQVNAMLKTMKEQTTYIAKKSKYGKA